MNHNSNMSYDIHYEYAGCNFVWNNEKANLNIEKRGISFEEAATVIVDDLTLYIKDEGHSDEEERFKAIGFSIKDRMLTVCHCIRENDELCRIITAWKATKAEEYLYKESMGEYK